MAARILIAEDDLAQREVLKDILDDAGYTVKSCGAAQDALNAD